MIGESVGLSTNCHGSGERLALVCLSRCCRGSGEQLMLAYALTVITFVKYCVNLCANCNFGEVLREYISISVLR